AAGPRPPIPEAIPVREALPRGDGGAPAATPAGPARARGSAGGRSGERVARGPRTGSAGGAPVPARDATGAGEGNAEEWLGAVPSSLAPAPDAPAPGPRIPLPYRKLRPARLFGPPEIRPGFLPAPRPARPPPPVSHGPHP